MGAPPQPLHWIVEDSRKSTMDEIWDEYTMTPCHDNQPVTHQEEFLSTEYWVQYYGEYELQADNQMLEAVQRTVNELQAALTLSATLIPARPRWYKINPSSMFTRILEGTNNVKLLNTAWKGLAGQLRCGHRFLWKYTIEFEHHIHPKSPVSTEPELYNLLSYQGKGDGNTWSLGTAV
ncbi:hypothetical protein EDD18DRAFT_1097763 [Armillaria luteobubalina]|uniref:Uncharacterized protein n=1 Tax=Armillaria luteobubalina TaxID=153913 RepID=A0AA39QQY4_9AGAR|nr:hypothetical protein EDD18DRAFT_1097763 [Armillaria luteobubalina]